MILPTKYLDLQASVLRIAALVLQELVREPILRVPDLAARIDAATNGTGGPNFFPSLNLLFLLGCIDADAEKDLILYTPPQANS